MCDLLNCSGGLAVTVDCAGPSHVDRLDQCGEWNGEENPPQTPQTAKGQDGNNNRNRVQIDGFREKQGHEEARPATMSLSEL